jgi:hypothetical protein
MLKQMVSKPAEAASTATRSPAKPAPMHSRSVYIVSNDFSPHLGKAINQNLARATSPMAIKIAVRMFSNLLKPFRLFRRTKPHFTAIR